MSNGSPSERNWFPVIVAGLTVLLAVVFYATNRSVDFSTWMRSGDDRRTSDVVADTITEEEYQAAVRAVLSSTDDMQSRYDALIVLRVPGSMQTFHIDLIIAFGKFATGDVADGQARLDALTAQYPWLSL